MLYILPLFHLGRKGKGETPIAKGQAQAANKQLATTNQIGAGQLQQAGQLESQLIPDYTSMLNEGYTPQQQSAMTTAGMGAVGSSVDAAQQSARNDAARTNNAAGLNENADKLALEGGVAQGDEAAGLQKSFADQQQKNQQTGLAGLEGLYNTNSGVGAGMYGLSPGILQARAAGGNTLGNIAGSLIGAAGAAAGG